MPYQVQSIGGNRYGVVGADGVVHAKSTTFPDAMRQVRLLRGVEHGTFKPTGKPARDTFRSKRGF